MTIIRGGQAGPNGVGGAYPNEVETDRSIAWFGAGGVQVILKGFVQSGVSGLMALDFTAGAALVGERAADGTASLDRGYLVWADTTTRVTFGPASASNRVDAVVAAFVDTEDGPVGTGALAVGPHLVTVPGTSGVATPLTDAQITAWLGRGGWLRALDVPVAAGATQINVATITQPTAARPPVVVTPNTNWQTYTPIVRGVSTGTTYPATLLYAKYRQVGNNVQVSAAATITSASTGPGITLPLVAVYRLFAVGNALLVGSGAATDQTGCAFLSSARDLIYCGRVNNTAIDNVAGHTLYISVEYETP